MFSRSEDEEMDIELRLNKNMWWRQRCSSKCTGEVGISQGNKFR